MRGNAARILVPALVVLGLVGVVAVAATGSTSTGTDDARAPADSILDIVVSLGVVLLVPAAALLVYGLMQRKDIKRQAMGMPRHGLLTTLIWLGLFGAVTYFRLRNWERPAFEDSAVADAFSDGEAAPTPGSTSPAVTAYEPEWTWIPAVVVGALIVIGVVAWIVAGRRSRLTFDPDEQVARELANALDDSLDALRAEPDPRRAVIAAYARLERVLAAHRLGRQESETPNEYLARILGNLEVERRSVRRLTDLFTEAKFSTHVVDAAMKEEAIEALTTVRDELRARREAQQQAARTPSLALETEAGGAKT